MRILVANKYFYRKGGAEFVALDTAELLRSRGHEIAHFAMAHPKNLPSEFSRYFVSNVDYEREDAGHALKVAGRMLYSFEARARIEQLIRDFRPDVAHLHNVYHQISPSILHSLKKFGVPVVMTLHDCKVVCASYLMLAGGKVCEACRGGRYYQCAVKACVKGSRAKSILNTFEMYFHHDLLHIYDCVDVFISPSQFHKDKIAEMGFKGRRVEKLSNFIHAENFAPRYDWGSKSICYVGRLSREKGVATLIDAAGGLDVEVKIIGEGPQRKALQARVKSGKFSNISFLGYKSGAEFKNAIRDCMFMVLPSECYENNPLSVMEAFALGKPVVGSRIGGIPELVRDNETGVTFKPFNVQDLREKILGLLRDPDAIERMGRNARRLVEADLLPEKHYERLMEIYSQAIEISQKRRDKR
jgi:glycosyltransferase involved in cell wall biosynthesis